MKGQFGPNGALYSGWETRRHNATYDWCIIRLGTSGTIHGLDIDTSNFNGNVDKFSFSMKSQEVVQGMRLQEPLFMLSLMRT